MKNMISGSGTVKQRNLLSICRKTLTVTLVFGMLLSAFCIDGSDGRPVFVDSVYADDINMFNADDEVVDVPEVTFTSDDIEIINDDDVTEPDGSASEDVFINGEGEDTVNEDDDADVDEAAETDDENDAEEEAEVVAPVDLGG